VVEAEAREINIEAEKIAEIKADADRTLKEAEPILKNAVEQLDKLNRGDISEIKSNNNPHALVRYTMECVAILLEEKTDWDHIKKQVLSDAGLLGKLKNLKGENIKDSTKAKIKKKCNVSNFSG
jgi:dynein heavy chain